MIMPSEADMRNWTGRFRRLHVSRRAASGTLAVIFACSLWLIYRLDLVRLFGLYHDDTLFMGAALALAEGRGT